MSGQLALDDTGPTAVRRRDHHDEYEAADRWWPSIGCAISYAMGRVERHGVRFVVVRDRDGVPVARVQIENEGVTLRRRDPNGRVMLQVVPLKKGA